MGVLKWSFACIGVFPRGFSREGLSREGREGFAKYTKTNLAALSGTLAALAGNKSRFREGPRRLSREGREGFAKYTKTNLAALSGTLAALAGNKSRFREGTRRLSREGREGFAKYTKANLAPLCGTLAAFAGKTFTGTRACCYTPTPACISSSISAASIGMFLNRSMGPSSVMRMSFSNRMPKPSSGI